MGIEFVNVTVDTSGLFAASARDYGTVAIVGVGGTEVTAPVKIGSHAEANTTYENTDLGKAVKLALLNGAASVWAVDVGTKSVSNVEAALAKLESLDVQIVCLANTVETADDAYVSEALKEHLDLAGTDRIGVFMLAKGEDAVTKPTAISDLLPANNTKLFCIAHNSDNDVAAAVSGLLAGMKPWESPVAKPLSGIVQNGSFTNTQLGAMKTDQINPVIAPVYMGGNTYVLRTDYTQGTAASGVRYVDTRRVIDDISYNLKAGLTNPNVIGTLRVDKSGLSELSAKIAAILGKAMADGAIESYAISIPVLNALAKDVSARSDVDKLMITEARTSKVIDAAVSVEYAGTFHVINIDFAITT